MSEGRFYGCGALCFCPVWRVCFLHMHGQKHSYAKGRKISLPHHVGLAHEFVKSFAFQLGSRLLQLGFRFLAVASVLLSRALAFHWVWCSQCSCGASAACLVPALGVRAQKTLGSTLQARTLYKTEATAFETLSPEQVGHGNVAVSVKRGSIS